MHRLQLTNVSRDTLRHYERKGVLARPVRSAKGYRLYPAKAIARVQLIRRALAVGFTLDELAQVLAERERGNVPCRTVHTLAVFKLENVKERLREMEMLRDELETLVNDWDKRLEENSKDEPVHLLEALSTSPENISGNQTKHRFGKLSLMKNKRKTNK